MEKGNVGVVCYRFSESATETPSDILNGLTPAQFLKKKYNTGCVFGLDTLKKSATYRYMGWLYDFTPHMKRFLVKQYGDWQEYYAPNKTALRKATYGEIQEIFQKV